MKTIVWTCFGIALVLVNVIAEVGEYFSGIAVPMLLRIAIIVGITLGALVLAGAAALLRTMDQEQPLAGSARDTLGPDRNRP